MIGSLKLIGSFKINKPTNTLAMLIQKTAKITDSYNYNLIESIKTFFNNGNVRFGMAEMSATFNNFLIMDSKRDINVFVNL